MTLWLIEPRDPVIFRDGRPFNASPGARATTLAYPFPSTVAGATRTRAGRMADGQFDDSRIDKLKAEEMRGPLLVQLGPENLGAEDLNPDKKIVDWLFPLPADALLLRPQDADSPTARLVPLTVLHTPAGAVTDLDGLGLVGTATAEKGKPLAKPPAFWHRHQFESWLLAPAINDTLDLINTSSWGPGSESRMHVSINFDDKTAEDGALFQTTGLRFTELPHNDDGGPPPLQEAKHLALALETTATLSAGIDFLGGERRAARWITPQAGSALPPCPDKVREAIKTAKHCRLILLTPALFTAGHLPTWIKHGVAGVHVEILAAAIHRYLTVSGWDYAYVGPDKRRGRPKPTRRLTPAGSVYFLKLPEDETAIDRFIEKIWMHNVSDADQDRLDGFGLAALGVWDGAPKEMEMAK